MNVMPLGDVPYDVIVPAEVWSSPQSILALNLEASGKGSASVNVATLAVNGTCSVAKTVAPTGASGASTTLITGSSTSSTLRLESTMVSTVWNVPTLV